MANLEDGDIIAEEEHTPEMKGGGLDFVEAVEHVQDEVNALLEGLAKDLGLAKWEVRELVMDVLLDVSEVEPTVRDTIAFHVATGSGPVASRIDGRAGEPVKSIDHKTKPLLGPKGVIRLALSDLLEG